MNDKINPDNCNNVTELLQFKILELGKGEECSSFKETIYLYVP